MIISEKPILVDAYQPHPLVVAKQIEPLTAVLSFGCANHTRHKAPKILQLFQRDKPTQPTGKVDRQDNEIFVLGAADLQPLQDFLRRYP